VNRSARTEAVAIRPRLARRTALTVVGAMAVSMVFWLPAARPALTEPQPPTSAKKVPVPLAAMVAGVPANAARVTLDGGVDVRRPLTTAPDSICAPIQFTAFGIQWRQRAPSAVRADVSTRLANATFARPTRVAPETVTDGPDAGSPEYHAHRGATQMLWVGAARCVRFSLRLPAGASISDVQAVFINTSGNPLGGPPVEPPLEAGASGFGVQPADAYAGEPAIISRARWGANESWKNCFAGYAPSLKMAFVHHTDNSNSYTYSQSDDLVRSIYYYHTHVNHWCDIGYNFLVSRYGQIFEGRWGGIQRPTIPAATMGFNTSTVAVSAIGDFVSATPPSGMVSAIERLLAWRLDVAHVNPLNTAHMVSGGGTGNRFKKGTSVWFHKISGHRDANYTACPGYQLYIKLPAIRSAVYAIGQPKFFGVFQTRTKMTPNLNTVTFGANDATDPLDWELILLDPEGNAVDHWTHSGGRSWSVTWHGMLKGAAAPPGKYVARLEAHQGSALTRRMGFDIEVMPAASPPLPG
jgi:hypothetical protein